MDEYLYYMLFAFGTVGGLVLGIITGLWVISDSAKPSIGRHVKKKKRNLNRYSIFSGRKNNEATGKEGGLLKHRIASDKSSWTEFTCIADNADEKSYIEKSRRKEERAYRYAKRRAGKEH